MTDEADYTFAIKYIGSYIILAFDLYIFMLPYCSTSLIYILIISGQLLKRRICARTLQGLHYLLVHPISALSLYCPRQLAEFAGTNLPTSKGCIAWSARSLVYVHNLVTYYMAKSNGSSGNWTQVDGRKTRLDASEPIAPYKMVTLTIRKAQGKRLYILHVAFYGLLAAFLLTLIITLNIPQINHFGPSERLIKLYDPADRRSRARPLCFKVFSDVVDALNGVEWSWMAISYSFPFKHFILWITSSSLDDVVWRDRLESDDPLSSRWSHIPDRPYVTGALWRDTSTAPCKVLRREPRGSVLGPLLFTHYTADSGHRSHHLGTRSILHDCYAEDDQLYFICTESAIRWSCVISLASDTSPAGWLQIVWNSIKLNRSFSGALILYHDVYRHFIFDGNSNVWPICSPYYKHICSWNVPNFNLDI